MKEMENIDHLFKSALGDFSEAPPPEVWDALEKRLDGEDRKRPGFAFRWFWVMLSICCVMAIGSAVAWKMHCNNTVVTSRTDNADPVIVTQAQPDNNATNASGRVSEHAAKEEAAKSERTEKEKASSSTTTKQPTTDNYIADNKATKQATDENKTVYHDPQNFNPAAKTITDDDRTNEPVEYVVSSSVKGHIMIAETESTQQTTGPRMQEPISEPEFSDEPKQVKKTATVNNDRAARLAMNSRAGTTKRHSRVQQNTARITDIAVNTNHTRTIKKTTSVKNIHTDKTKETNALAGSAHISGTGEKKLATVKTTGTSETKAVTKKVEPVVKKDNTQAVVKQSAAPKKVNTVAEETAQVTVKKPTQTLAVAIKKDAAKPAQKLNVKKKTQAVTTPATAEHTATLTAVHNGNIAKREDGKKVTKPVAAETTVAKKTNETSTVTSATKKEPKAEKVNKVQPVENALESTAVEEKKKVAKTAAPKVEAKQSLATTTPKIKSVAKSEVASNIPATKNTAVTSEVKKQADAKKAVIAKNKNAETAILAANKPSTHADKKKKEVVKNSKPQKINNTVAANTTNDKKKNNSNTSNSSKKKNNAPTQPQPAAATPQPTAPIAAMPAPVTKPLEATSDLSTASSTSSQMKVTNAAAVPAKDTAVNAAAAGTAANDSSAKMSFWKKFKYEAGIKAGFETGFSSTAGNKVVVSPYIEWILNSRMSLLVQPSFKTSFVQSVRLKGNQNFYSPYGDSTVNYVTSTPIYVVIGPGVVDTLIKRTYHYSQSKDSITKTYAAAAGHYQEYDLPLLFKYALTPKLSVYGGVNLTYSRYAYTAIKENTNELKVGIVADSFTITSLHAPVPAPPYVASTIHFTGNPISTYSGPLYPPPPSGGMFRMGYMLGFSYEYKKRWMIDMLMQQASAKTNTEGGINLNKALSANYFRFTLGYKLKK